jgi:hypothetical protein
MKSSVEHRNACVAVSVGWSKIHCCIRVVAQNRHEKSELEINVTDSSAIRGAVRDNQA